MPAGDQCSSVWTPTIFVNLLIAVYSSGVRTATELRASAMHVQEAAAKAAAQKAADDEAAAKAAAQATEKEAGGAREALQASSEVLTGICLCHLQLML